LVNVFGKKVEQQIERIQSGVALRLPPHSKERRLTMFGHARHSDFALEGLPSSNLAVAAAVLSFCSDLFPICA
jgi:hypothetical protein